MAKMQDIVLTYLGLSATTFYKRPNIIKQQLKTYFIKLKLNFQSIFDISSTKQ